jgi:hypothetical protein
MDAVTILAACFAESSLATTLAFHFARRRVDLLSADIEDLRMELRTSRAQIASLRRWAAGARGE